MSRAPVLDLERLGATAECLCFNVRLTARGLTAYYDAILAPSGVTITQFGLLVMVFAYPGAPVTRLAQQMLTSKSTLVRNLRLLEDAGLIRIKPGKRDKRERIAAITANGRRALQRALPHWEQAQQDLLDAVDPKPPPGFIGDFASLNKALVKLRSA